MNFLNNFYFSCFFLHFLSLYLLIIFFIFYYIKQFFFVNSLYKQINKQERHQHLINIIYLHTHKHNIYFIFNKKQMKKKAKRESEKQY